MPRAKTAKTRKRKAEVAYVLEHQGAGNAHVHKFEGLKEVPGYLIEDGLCSCAGSHYTGDCKHVDMLLANPPSEPKPISEAAEIARDWIRDLRKTGDVRILGDLAWRRDPVRFLHFAVRGFFPCPLRIVRWWRGMALLVDKVSAEYLTEEEVELDDLVLFR